MITTLRHTAACRAAAATLRDRIGRAGAGGALREMRPARKETP